MANDLQAEICDQYREALADLLAQHKAALSQSVNAAGAADRLRASGEANRIKERIDEIRGQIARECGADVLAEPDGHADLTQRLVDLLSQTDKGAPPPWHEWIENVRAAVNPLLTVPGGSPDSWADWLLDYTSADQPLAIGLLHHAESHVNDPAVKKQIGALARAIRVHYDIPRTAIDEVDTRIASILCKTALVVRLSGGESDVFAIEIYEFWSRGDDAPEQHRRVDLPIGRGQVDLSALDPDALSLPGVVSRPQAVAAIMEHLAAARFVGGVEVVAASGLMMRWDAAPEVWQTGNGFTLGLRHPVVLRSVKGFEGSENPHRRAHWETVLKRQFKSHACDCTGLRGDGLDALRAKGRVAVIDACGHGPEQLDRCAEAGLSVVIWLRRGLDQGCTALACLQSELSSCKVSAVPEQLRALRGRLADDRGNPRFRSRLTNCCTPCSWHCTTSTWRHALSRDASHPRTRTH